MKRHRQPVVRVWHIVAAIHGAVKSETARPKCETRRAAIVVGLARPVAFRALLGW
jgi:hypothetical protein